MVQHLRKWYWVLILLALLVCLALAGGLSFLAGKAMGSQNTPTAQPSSTAKFPALHTATPTRQPTHTSTPFPTGTPTMTPTLTSTPTSTPTPTPTPRVIITEVKSLGRLETSKFMLQSVIDLEREPSNIWEQILGTDKLLLIAEGEVVAGFDLTQVQKKDIRVHGDQVTLVLPPAQILYSKVDNERTYVYERSTGLFRAPDPRIESEARQLAEQSMLERAREGEILKQAEANGRLQIEAFLRSLGFTDIQIIIEGDF